MTIFGYEIHKKPLTETKEKTYTRKITKRIENGGFVSPPGLEEIFLGEDPNYNLSIGPYAKSISTVCSLIGTPQIPRHDNPNIQKQRNRLQKLINDEYPIIIKLAMIHGTHWVFPYYAEGRNIIDHIKDYEIQNGSVRVDPITREIKSIVTKQLVYWTPDNQDYFEYQKQSWRSRYFSREKIVDDFESKIKTYRNVLRIMPIPFAVDSLGDWRGNSFLTPILRLAGDAHRIRARRDEILSTYKPNAVVKTDNLYQWINNNCEALGIGDDEEYDIFKTDVKFCKSNEEFRYDSLMGGVVSDHNSALQDIDIQIQMSERLPFIYSGAESKGNHATGTFQEEQGIFFINDLRRQLYKPAYTFLNALNNQDSYIEGIQPEELEPNYSRMELMTDEQQINVLERGMATIAQMTNSRIPIEVAFNTLKNLFDFKYGTPEELQDAIHKLKEKQPVDAYSSIF
ncbi:hypothetical protein FACS1894151_08150 [Spirochaetia bacterium]|nr:hypothetical protein FACS1894151_08150 [Spirochaetia bacterium]